MHIEGSRRRFVGGAVAGAAVIGGAAMLGRNAARSASAGEGVTVVTGGGPVSLSGPAPADLDGWKEMVGRPVHIATERGYATGTVASVDRAPSGGPRPAGARREPFSVTLLADRASAPATDGIFEIGRAIEGLSRLFLVRGGDRGAQAVLLAHFN